MAVLFDGVDLRLEVAFTSSATSTTWTDITSYVRSISWSRGRQRELEQCEPGTLQVELLNSDRRFDTFNAAGAYYPYVTPQRNVRLTAVYATVTYELWRGHVTDWAQTWDLPQFALCQMAAIDDLTLLARQTFDDAYVYEVLADNPITYLRLGESSGTLILDEISNTFGVLTGDEDGLESSEPLIAGTTNGAIAFNGTSMRVRHTECARRTSLPFSVELWYAYDGADLELLARQGSGEKNDGWSIHAYNGTIIASSPFYDDEVLVTTDVLPGMVHHLVYVRDSGQHKIYVNGVDQPTTTGTVDADAYEGLLLGGTTKAEDWFSGYLDEVAVYDQALTWPQVLTHYAAGVAPWSGETTGQRFEHLADLLGVANSADPGATTLGGAFELPSMTALEQLQRVTSTEGGAMWIDGAGVLRFADRHSPITSAVSFTLGDQGGEIEFRTVTLAPAADLIRNKISVNRIGGYPQTVEDAASQAAYLTNVFEQSEMLYTDDLTSLYAAQWLLGRYKDPVQRIDSVEVTPRSDPAVAYPAILGLDVADKAAINVRPTAGATIAQTAIVEGFTHMVTPDSWTTTLALSPAETRPYLVVGSATLGKVGTGRFGF